MILCVYFVHAIHLKHFYIWFVIHNIFFFLIKIYSLKVYIISFMPMIIYCPSWENKNLTSFGLVNYWTLIIHLYSFSLSLLSIQHTKQHLHIHFLFETLITECLLTRDVTFKEKWVSKNNLLSSLFSLTFFDIVFMPLTSDGNRNIAFSCWNCLV